MGGEPIFLFRSNSAADKIREKLRILRSRLSANSINNTSPVFGEKEPFAVRRVEARMKKYANEHGIELSSKSINMSAEKILHAIRTTKRNAGKVLSDEDIISFPTRVYKMDLYYDKRAKNFVYVDETNKFVVEPSYSVKLKNGKIKKVLIITMSKMKSASHFNNAQFEKIK